MTRTPEAKVFEDWKAVMIGLYLFSYNIYRLLCGGGGGGGGGSSSIFCL